MKKSLLTFLIALAAICMISLPNGAAYAANELPAPTNPNVVTEGASTAFVWDNVEGNFGYNVYVDGVKFTVSQNVTEQDITDICTEARPYTLKVFALNEEGTESVNYAEYTLTRAVKLATPTVNGVSDAKIFSWAEVSNASSYSLVVNGVEVGSALTDCEFDLSATLANVGDYTIRVAAIGDGFNYLDGKYSTAFVYTNKLILDTPSNLSIALSDGDIVATWGRVPFSAGYTVTVDGTDYTAESNSFDLTSYVESVKDYSVSVKAKEHGNFLASAAASTTYRTTATLASPVLSLDGAVVSWNSVEHAATYSVKVNDTLCAEAQTATSFDLSTVCAAPGTYTVKVAANTNGNYAQSTISSIVYNNHAKLATPVPTVSGSVVSWTAVPNAGFYSLFVDGALKDSQISATNVDVTDYCPSAANYAIEISANANGYYSASDKGSVNYAHYVAQQTVVLDVDDLTVSWLEIFTADSYTVTVDGETVTENCTDTSIDLSEYLTEDKVYVIGVFANAKDYFTAGTSATVNVTGVAPLNENVTYTLSNYSYSPTHIVFVDGVRSSVKPTSDSKLTLPSTAVNFAIVEDAETIYSIGGSGETTAVYYKQASVSSAENDVISLEYAELNLVLVYEAEESESIAESLDGYAYHYLGGTRYYPE